MFSVSILKGRFKVVLFSWSAFISFWFLTSLLLSVIEDGSEHEDIKKFRRTWERLYNSEDDAAQDSIDSFLDVMQSTCHIPTVADENWNVSRHVLFNKSFISSYLFLLVFFFFAFSSPLNYVDTF
jgi:hypothetical protein